MIFGDILHQILKKEKQPKRGDDVHLTIDSNIQVFVEEALDGMVERYQPKDLFAVVMDAKTGEILAYSQRPTFNPETGKDFGKSGQMIYIKTHMSLDQHLNHMG